MQSTGEANETRSTVQDTIDRLSLEQALLDFEVANARVLDLTRRLIEANTAISEINTELQELQISYAQLKSDHERMQSSKAYAIAGRIWALRNAVHR